MTETGGTSDWLGCRAFGLTEPRAEPGRQSERVLGGSWVPKSLNDNNQAGLRASWGEGRPVAASCLGLFAGTKAMRGGNLLSIKEYGIFVRFRFTQTAAGPRNEGRNGVEVEGMVRVARGG